MNAKIVLTDKRAEVPKRAHDSDTGYDIKIIDVNRIVDDVIFFETGVKISPPKGHYFEIYPRSSISKTPFALANSVGVIDEHYRGEVIIAARVINNGTLPILDSKIQDRKNLAQYVINYKPKLFQLILREKLSVDFEQVNELDETERGSGGFGSTDNKK